MDVDPKLQTNRVADLGRTVRPSSRAAGVALLVALAVMSVFGAICAASGHGFDIFALLYILSGQWEFTGAQWALAGLLVILAGALAGLCWWLLARKVAPKVIRKRGPHQGRRVRAELGHGEARVQGTPGTGREDGVPSRQGLRPETHGAGLSARPQHRGRNAHEHQLGGHGDRACRTPFRKVPVLRDPAVCSSPGPCLCDLEQGRTSPT